MQIYRDAWIAGKCIRFDHRRRRRIRAFIAFNSSIYLVATKTTRRLIELYRHEEPKKNSDRVELT